MNAKIGTVELSNFVAVARARSFTKAAARLRVSPSALSHGIQALEERLGLRLLTRTTRSVSPTEVGERLLRIAGPRLDEIDAEIDALTAFSEHPKGSVRITADEHAIEAVLWPRLGRFLAAHPGIAVEIVTDYGLTDIAADAYDAGVRLGGMVAKDMIAVPIGPPMRMAAVASPSYLAENAPPASPQDLTAHSCINLRLPTHGGLYAWEFERAGRATRVHVEGRLTFNSIRPILQAAVDGFGIAFVAEGYARAHLESGILAEVLADWSPPFAGYHIYYPSRRQQPAAFALMVEALRFRPS